jgi:hypothetical protein
MNADAHRASDVDNDTQAGHHTLGNRANQAAAGNHRHYPVGCPLPFFGPHDLIPEGFVNGDGRSLLKSEAPQLYKALGSGTIYGETLTQFTIPDLVKRSLYGGQFTTDVGLNDGQIPADRQTGARHSHTIPNTDASGSHDHGGTNDRVHSTGNNTTLTGAGQRVIAIGGSTTQHNHGIPSSLDHTHGMSSGSNLNAIDGDLGRAYIYCWWIFKVE